MMETGNDSDIDDLDRKPAAKVFPKSSISSQRTLKISPGCTEVNLDVSRNTPVERRSRSLPDSSQNLKLVNTNDAGSLEEYPCLISRKLLDDYSDEKKNLHRIALFRLFNSGNYTASRLTDIAQKCGLNEQQNGKFKIKEMLVGYQKISNNKRLSVDIDPSLPHKIGNLALKNKYNCFTIGESIFGDKQKLQSLGIRSGYTAMKLPDLEKSIRGWYQKSMQNRDNTRSSPNKAPTFFTLRFNEGSLFMLSKWACINKNPKTSSVDESIVNDKNNTETTSVPLFNQPINGAKLSNVATVVRQPTIDARFRKCSICNLWGHYELECRKMPYETVLRLGEELEGILTRKGQASATTLDPHFSEPKIIDESQPKLLNFSSTPDSNTHDVSKADLCVTVEIFDGFVFEQRSEHETFRQISKPEEEKNPSNLSKYDDSFMVDGFKIKAASSLPCLQDGRSTEVVPESKELKKKRKRIEKQNRIYQVTKNQRKPGSRSNFGFCEGDVVAWFPAPDVENQDVFTGIVVKVPKPSETKIEERKMILVEFLASVPASPGAKSETISHGVDLTLEDHANKTGIPKTCDHGDYDRKWVLVHPPPIGSGIWISFDDLHLVQEHADVAYPEYLIRKKRKYSSRKKAESTESAATSKERMKPMKKASTLKVPLDLNHVAGAKKISKARGSCMPYSERFKETGRLQGTDMSLAPRKPAKKRADGTFSMPQGRRPGKYYKNK